GPGRGHLRLHGRAGAVGAAAAQARRPPRPAGRRGARPARGGAARHRGGRVRRPGDRGPARGPDGRSQAAGTVCGGGGGAAGRGRPGRGRRPPAAADRLGLAVRHRPVRGRAAARAYQGDHPMIRFLQPAWLLTAVPVLLLAGVYVWRTLHRRAYALKFTNVDLLKNIAPKGIGWRRHPPSIPFIPTLLIPAAALAPPSGRPPP